MLNSYIWRTLAVVAVLAGVGFAASSLQGRSGATAKVAADAHTGDAPADSTPAQDANTPAETAPEGGTVSPATFTSSAEQIAWKTSFATALKEAKANDKLIIVDFYTDWCGYCKKLDAEVYPDAKVVGIVKQMIPIKLNAEKDGQDVADRYRDSISGFPTILFINGNGEVEEKIGGYMPAASFADSLTAILKQHRDLPELDRNSRAHPEDASAAAQLTNRYARFGRTKAAVEALQRLQKADPNDKTGDVAIACNSVASMFERRRDFVTGVPYLQQALKTAKRPVDKGFARMNLALCYALQKKPNDAKKQLKVALAIPEIPDDMHQKMDEMLNDIEHGGVR